MRAKKPIHLCVPVLRRYDLLHELLKSLGESTVEPGEVHIIDNGKDAEKLEQALLGVRSNFARLDIFTPTEPLGVAKSWNWFIKNVPEERLIVNDDLTFGKESLQRIVESEGDFVTGTRGEAFSCFLLRDSCVSQVGLFDETLSPGYAYFEDCDYEERMLALNIFITHVDCGVVHCKSSTLAAATPEERRLHHWKFLAAQENFVTKWGRLPRGMQSAS